MLYCAFKVCVEFKNYIRIFSFAKKWSFHSLFFVDFISFFHFFSVYMSSALKRLHACLLAGAKINPLVQFSLDIYKVT